MLFKLAIVAETSSLRRQLESLSNQLSVESNTLKGGPMMFERLARSGSDLLLISRSLFPPAAGDMIGALRRLPDPPMIVVLSTSDNAEDSAQLIAAGAELVLSPTVSNERLAEVLSSLLDKRRVLATATVRKRRAPPKISDFVSNSRAMQAFVDLVRRVAPSDASLLILGETGVGKEHLARAIHAESPRAQGAFVAVNCAALPDELLESELFGHEEGAFTGATRTHRGSFELAHRGTLFLDEIGEMPLHLQVKLLRALQESMIQRLGSERSIAIDVRVMAATNRDIAADSDAQRFRRDLYFRLSVVTLTVPPLRERKEDIPSLVESHINYLRTRVNRPVTSITPEALHALQTYDWPGNVRELMNVLERSMLLCSGKTITLAELPHAIRKPVVQHLSTPADVSSGNSLPPDTLRKTWRQVRNESLARIEKDYLMGLLRQTKGRIGETARLAGMQPRAVFEKMRRHGLQKEDFRSSSTPPCNTPDADTGEF